MPECDPVASQSNQYIGSDQTDALPRYVVSNSAIVELWLLLVDQVRAFLGVLVRALHGSQYHNVYMVHWRT